MKFVMPDVVTSHFHLREGDHVADFGAGRGFFLRPLAEAVGQEGKVYLIEIQRELAEFVGEQIHQAGTEQASVIWCDLEEENGISLPDDALDAGIVVNTLFQLEDKQTALTEILRTLRRGAKLIVIDWTESVPGLGPQREAVVSQADCVALLESLGCVFEREFPAGEHHYGLAFRVV